MLRTSDAVSLVRLIVKERGRRGGYLPRETVRLSRSSSTAAGQSSSAENECSIASDPKMDRQCSAARVLVRSADLTRIAP
ncbi:MAG: hypothetical protein JW940_38775 [Polyangiaceae bacterium]|nr:hypothetical protein [Polyangiaceae bacterium]